MWINDYINLRLYFKEEIFCIKINRTFSDTTDKKYFNLVVVSAVKSKPLGL